MKRIGVMAALLFAGCLSQSDFSKMVAEAATCSAGDPCVETAMLPNGCTCTSVVRASEKANIEAAARQVWCGGMMAKCAVRTNPRCVGGTCVADPAH
jgi:hypothetical protein